MHVIRDWLRSPPTTRLPDENEVERDLSTVVATAADEAVFRREAVGPLHGVPLTVKEAFNVEGLHTTWGNPEWKDFVADWDATVVGRLRAAGAIVVGKTNAHQ